VALRALAAALNEGLEQTIHEVHELRAELGGDVAGANNGSGANEPPIAFVHIPKTAGGSATSMLAQAFTKSALFEAGNYMKGPEATVGKIDRRDGGWQSWQRRGGRVAVGHVPYGIFAGHLPPDTRYMVFLREPVDRVLSHYHRHIHKSEVDSVAIDSLEQGLASELPQLTNLMTRFLCSGSDLPSEPLHADALEEAKQNLRGFAFIGIQERFDESLILLQRLLGLEQVTYVNRHVSTDRPEVEEISAVQRELILEHNRLDVELYEFAVELFDDAADAADGQIAVEAERLRELSAEANAKTISDAVAFLDRELPEGSTRTFSSLAATAREQGISPLAVKQVRRNRVFITSSSDEDGDLCWTRSSNGFLEAALELLRRELPEGTTKTKSELSAKAKELGLPHPAVQQARNLLSISKSSNEAGEYLWTREPAATAKPPVGGD
jgi:hypothetical protein